MVIDSGLAVWVEMLFLLVPLKFCAYYMWVLVVVRFDGCGFYFSHLSCAGVFASYFGVLCCYVWVLVVVHFDSYGF